MMKKYLVLTALTLTLAGGILAGCGNTANGNAATSQGQDIGSDSAKEIALKDAGVAESDATRFRVTKERDDGRNIYEVEFSVQEKEYNYDISAENGEILSAEQDIDRDYVSSQNTQTTEQTQTENSQQNQTVQNNTQQNVNTQQNASVAVSEADAKAAALERVPGATEQDMRMELEFDDGQYVYEGDIIYTNKEYEFEIDANTGNFLKWSEENY